MRKLQRYSVSALAVHDDCVGGVGDLPTLTRLGTMRGTVSAAASEFDSHANIGELYKIPSSKTPPDTPLVNSATRRDLTYLYERQMVPRGRPGRKHYDPILASAPQQKCPYCGFGQATTLDHYLPKCRFPQYSILPSNLVPSCRDCQSKKGRYIAKKGSAQTLHPCFERTCFFNDRWIVGEVVQGPPTTVIYRVQPPNSWDNLDKQRAQSHFDAHGLKLRFAIETATELAVLRELHRQQRAVQDYNGVRFLLNLRAEAHFAVAVNSWQCALYSALATSHWYCNAPDV
jgi:hypothetical protein